MKTVDIIIPVYNEEKTLEAIIKKIEETDFCGLEKHLILINDCSTDSSCEILKKYSSDYTVLHLEKNSGKGAAVRMGFRNCCSDIVVIQDADLEYNPEDYNKLLPLIINGEADVVYGSRLSDNSQRKAFLFLSYAANKFLTLLTNILYGCKISDMETCYKAFRRDVIKNVELRANRYDFEVEITAKLVKNGVKIKEVPISYNGRNWDDGKKISAIDGMQAVFALLFYRFFA